MTGQARFIVLILAFVLAAGALWWWVQRGAPQEDIALAPTVPAPEMNWPKPDEPAPPVPEPSADTPAPAADDAEPAEDEAEPPTTGTGVIIVDVIDQNGNAAAYATIEARRIHWYDDDDKDPDNDLMESAQTDGQGRHTFSNLPEGTFVVAAWTDTATENAEVSINDGGKETLTLTLQPGAPMGGIVVTTSGEPIEGAVLHLYMTSNLPGQQLATSRSTAAAQTTDEYGRFRFPMLWSGTWRFYITKEGYAPFVTGWERAGDTNLRFALGGGATLRGRAVLDATQEPVAALPVRLRSGYTHDKFTATTNEDGAFEIAHVRPGDYTLISEHEQLVLAHEPPKIEIAEFNDPNDHLLRLTEGAVVSGRVYETDSGRGISGATVRNYSSLSGPREATTDSNGAYTLTGIPGGQARVYLSELPGYSIPQQDREQVLLVEPAKNYDNVDFGILRGLSVSGRVVDSDNAPIAEARIAVRPQNSSDSLNARSDEAGRFRITGLQVPGKLTFDASKDGYGRKNFSRELLDKDLRDVEIVLEEQAFVEGIVVDSQNRPVSGAQICAFKDGVPSLYLTGDESDGSGRFEISGLESGRYSLQLVRPGGNSWDNEPEAVVEVEEGGRETGVRLVLDVSGATLTGRVVNSKGEPIVGARIQGWDDESFSAQSGADGRFEVTGLKRDEVQLTLYHADYSQTQTRAAVDGNDVQIVMHGQGTVEGTIVNANTGQPITTFEYQAYTGEWQAYRESNFTRIANPDGAFETTVDAGDVTVTAEAEGFARAHVPVGTVREDETLDNIVIRLRPAALVEGVVVDNTGAAVSGARVYADVLPRQGYERDRAALAVTDADGRFELNTASPETTQLHAWHPRYAPGSAPIALVSNQTTRVRIVLPLGATVQGRVTENGRAIPGAFVNVNIDGGNFHSSTDTDGMYEIAGLAAGSARMNANPQNGDNLRLQRTVDLEDGAIHEVNFDFKPADAAIEGRVTLDGQPLSGWIVATNLDTGQVGNTEVFSDGAFHFEAIPAGAFTLNFNGTGSIRAVREVETRSGEVTYVDINIDGGIKLHGVVNNVPDGYFTTAALFNADATMPRTMDEAEQLFQCCNLGNATGEDFNLIGLEPGDYNLMVLAYPQELLNDNPDPNALWQNALRAWQPVTIEPDQPTDIRIELN